MARRGRGKGKKTLKQKVTPVESLKGLSKKLKSIFKTKSTRRV